jgi:hypothetical protein
MSMLWRQGTSFVETLLPIERQELLLHPNWRRLVEAADNHRR